MKNITSIFIANRGEIAVRVIQAAHKLGIRVVTAYTPNDIKSLHVEMADLAVPLQTDVLADTFLSPEKMVETAVNSDCDALHPGYGFLSEDYRLAELCEQKGLVFIGPSSKIIREMGDKTVAAKKAGSVNVPVLSALHGELDELKSHAANLQYPVLIKAAAGGGGKGMRKVSDKKMLGKELEQASREARNYFGDGRVYIEPYLENARHIEVQLLGDLHGNLVHLLERECSLQRKHQKVIEEAPAISISNKVKNELYNAALRIGKAVGYTSAGTVEFLVDENENFYFLEMNTRIQVEHGITEEITGIDLVAEQIKIAKGKPMQFNQKNIKSSGFAIEARLYAEDPLKDFRPSPGQISRLEFPENKFFRIETAMKAGINLPETFDPLLAKLIAKGASRTEAISNLKMGLSETNISGIVYNLKYLEWIVESEEFYQNKIHTTFLSEKHGTISKGLKKENALSKKAGLAGYAFLHFISGTAQPANVWESIGFWRFQQKIKISENTEVHVLSWAGNNNVINFIMDDEPVAIELSYITPGEIEVKMNKESYRLFYTLGSGETLVSTRGFLFRFHSNDVLAETRIERISSGTNRRLETKIVSPLFGKVVKIEVSEKQRIRKGEVILILESMKMENAIVAPDDAVIQKIEVKGNEMVKENQVLLELDYLEKMELSEVLPQNR